MKEVEPKTVKSRAPVRVSFSGGGTDVPPFSEEHGGCVLSTTINKYIAAEISSSQDPKNNEIVFPDLGLEAKLPYGERYLYSAENASEDPKLDIVKASLNVFRPDKPVRVFLHGDAPSGSGMGTSSASNVALVTAFRELKGTSLDKQEIAEEAIRIERGLLQIPGGFQDQYASAFGGFNFIEFLPNEKRIVHPLDLSDDTKSKLHASLGLFYLGGVHSERTQQKELISAMKTNLDALEALKLLKKQTIEMKTALENGDLETFGKLLHAGWELKKRSSSAVSNPVIDAFYESALNAGTLGGKLLGSGGSGYLLLFTPIGKRSFVERKLVQEGAEELAFNFDEEGAVIT